ncbi:MAG: hypothetical protein RIK87_14660 [Fuerstiella sp.]
MPLTKLCPGPERDTLIDLLQTGDFYEHVADLAGHDWTDRAELKQEFQRHCLFGRSKKFGRHPLFVTLQRLAPSLAGYIMRRRMDRHGITRLAYELQRGEGWLMIDHAQAALTDADIPYVGVHDGVMVPESQAESFRELVLRQAHRLFGDVPAVKIG